MKRFSVIVAILLASFVGSIAAPVFAQTAAPAAPAEEKKPMKKAVHKKAVKKKAVHKKAMKKEEGMKKEEAPMEKK